MATTVRELITHLERLDADTTEVRLASRRTLASDQYDMYDVGEIFAGYHQSEAVVIIKPGARRVIAQI